MLRLAIIGCALLLSACSTSSTKWEQEWPITLTLRDGREFYCHYIREVDEATVLCGNNYRRSQWIVKTEVVGMHSDIPRFSPRPPFVLSPRPTR